MADLASGPGSLPGTHTSPWLARTDDVPRFDPLAGDETADVAIVGAGIAGLSTAAELADRGYDVVVLERDRVAGGVTGRSTAKVTSQHGLLYDDLRDSFGGTRARQYASANQAAIETVASRVAALEIADDCGFRRCPAYVYGDDRGAIEREADAEAAAGLPASFVTSVPPFESADCGVRVDDQACLDPRRYLLALAETLVDGDIEASGSISGSGSAVSTGGSGASPTSTGDGSDSATPAGGDSSFGSVAVHEKTRVTAVEPGRTPTVETDRGTVTADRVVLATGFPLLDRLGLFARLAPKRSYVLAVRIDEEAPEGLYYRPAEGSRPYRSVRAHVGTRSGGTGTAGGDETAATAGPLVLVGGENHKTGQAGSTCERYRRLVEWAEERFDVQEVAYRWSTQDYVAADRVPLVGPAGPGARNVSIATGFGGWGMTGGTVAGRLLAQLLDGEEPPIASLYDPRRFTPVASIGQLATENADVAGQFATDWLRTLLGPGTVAVEPGEGRVVRRDGRPIAVSRDEDGELHAVSAICSHAYCVVDWNDGEGTWDCPCHGSRFDPDGRLIEGPATDGLSAAEHEATGECTDHEGE
ncbi:FAD dependent oxidoreductase [Halovivax asiaticus JCM 14624]|uniref:FAD dependent oxidoreductase n=1 Tax=Halovivax asiaticus JCM 14624 TaxID=1227490 RepID=M0BMT9_9EURY|nr:FAD-dependent oxidoreductase [Halovivax asiaticus]ELZ11603.1 FAD dependent oxidoreductase [Halovivax asiaticus JCM 14624]